MSRRGFGGVVREYIPPATPGTVKSAPFLGPPTVTFKLRDWLHGEREVTVEVSPDEIVAVR